MTDSSSSCASNKNLANIISDEVNNGREEIRSSASNNRDSAVVHDIPVDNCDAVDNNVSPFVRNSGLRQKELCVKGLQSDVISVKGKTGDNNVDLIIDSPTNQTSFESGDINMLRCKKRGNSFETPSSAAEFPQKNVRSNEKLIWERNNSDARYSSLIDTLIDGALSREGLSAKISTTTEQKILQQCHLSKLYALSNSGGIYSASNNPQHAHGGLDLSESVTSDFGKKFQMSPLVLFFEDSPIYMSAGNPTPIPRFTLVRFVRRRSNSYRMGKLPDGRLCEQILENEPISSFCDSRKDSLGQHSFCDRSSLNSSSNTTTAITTKKTENSAITTPHWFWSYVMTHLCMMQMAAVILTYLSARSLRHIGVQLSPFRTILHVAYEALRSLAGPLIIRCVVLVFQAHRIADDPAGTRTNIIKAHDTTKNKLRSNQRISNRNLFGLNVLSKQILFSLGSNLKEKVKGSLLVDYCFCVIGSCLFYYTSVEISFLPRRVYGSMPTDMVGAVILPVGWHILCGSGGSIFHAEFRTYMRKVMKGIGGILTSTVFSAGVFSNLFANYNGIIHLLSHDMLQNAIPIFVVESVVLFFISSIVIPLVFKVVFGLYVGHVGRDQTSLYDSGFFSMRNRLAWLEEGFLIALQTYLYVVRFWITHCILIVSGNWYLIVLVVLKDFGYLECNYVQKADAAGQANIIKMLRGYRNSLKKQSDDASKSVELAVGRSGSSDSPKSNSDTSASICKFHWSIENVFRVTVQKLFALCLFIDDFVPFRYLLYVLPQVIIYSERLTSIEMNYATDNTHDAEKTANFVNFTCGTELIRIENLPILDDGFISKKILVKDGRQKSVVTSGCQKSNFHPSEKCVFQCNTNTAKVKQHFREFEGGMGRSAIVEDDSVDKEEWVGDTVFLSSWASSRSSSKESARSGAEGTVSTRSSSKRSASPRSSSKKCFRRVLPSPESSDNTKTIKIQYEFSPPAAGILLRQENFPARTREHWLGTVLRETLERSSVMSARIQFSIYRQSYLRGLTKLSVSLLLLLFILSSFWDPLPNGHPFQMSVLEYNSNSSSTPISIFDSSQNLTVISASVLFVLCDLLEICYLHFRQVQKYCTS